MLDDGRLTGGQGHTVDFRNTVIVITSNLGSDVIQQKAGAEHYAEMKDAVMEVVRVAFRPEFINRLDELVVFHLLQQEQIRAIARIQIRYLRERLEEREIKLVVVDAALDHLGEAGFDLVYGRAPSSVPSAPSWRIRWPRPSWRAGSDPATRWKMNPLLTPAVFREKRGVEPGVNQSSSESWNGRERSTRRSSRMPPRSRYRP